jgi:uncharacterized membrane protein YeaQ/YmgE (transglycosylase-associated protein family)
MGYQTQYRPQEQEQTPAASQGTDMGSLMIGLVAGFIGGLIGIAVTYFWGSKLTRQDRLIGALIGTVVAIVLWILIKSQSA